MKKVALVSLALLVAVAFSGCYGPQILTRTVDDWAQQLYVDTPWLAGNVISYTLISWATGITWMVDGIVNMYYFWVKDAQPFGTGVGTEFKHKAIVVPKGK